MQTKERKRLFSWRLLPMDASRVLCAPLPLYFRVKRITPEGKPYKKKIRGGAVLAANHTSFLDPVVVGVTAWYRRVHFLAAEVVMKGKLRSLLLKGVGAIRIDRIIADIEAIRKAAGVLKQGRVLVIFPQGGISPDAQIQSLKSGAVFIALQAGVPIVPMYICPQKRWYQRRVVVIGETIEPQKHILKKFPSTEDIENISKMLMDEMNRCMACR